MSKKLQNTLFIPVQAFLTTLCFFILSYPTYSQAPDWQWVKTAGTTSAGTGNNIATDAAGNSYVTGQFENTAIFGATTLANAGASDIFLVKYDSLGNVLWARGFGGSGDDRAYGIATDSKGNVFITGSVQSAGMSIGNIVLSTTGFFIAKFAADGTALWAKTAGGGASFHNNGGNCIATDTAGNVCVVGSFLASLTFGATTLVNSGNGDIFVAKYDSTGNALWAVSGDGGVNTGDDNYGNGIATDQAGDIYITGSCGPHTVFSGHMWGVQGLIVVKYSAAGVVQWLYGSNSGGGVGSGITVSGGNVHVVGWFVSAAITIASYSAANASAGNSDILLARFNAASGNPYGVWGIGGSRDDEAYNITTDNNGDMYMTGKFQSASVAVPFSNTLINPNPGYQNLFVIKYTPVGFGNHAAWVKSAGNGNVKGSGIAVNADGSGIYLTGNYFISATFGSTTVSNSSGNYGIFTAGLGSTILPVSAISYTLTQKENNIIHSWKVNDDRDIARFVIERSTDNKNFTAIASIQQGNAPVYSYTERNITSEKNLYYRLKIMHRNGITQYSDIRMAAIHATTATIKIYPNPATDYITITGSCRSIEITDLAGRILLARNTSTLNQETRIDISALPRGMYTVQCRYDQSTVEQRLVIDRK